MDVPALLVQARSRARLTRTQLADQAGTSPSALSAYEGGRRSPTVRTLDRLLATCGLQLRTALEPYLADLDAAADALLHGDIQVPGSCRRLAEGLDEAGVAWAFDAETAVALHGLAATSAFPAIALVGDDGTRRLLHQHGVDVVDRRGEPLWRSWLDVDLGKVGVPTAYTRLGVFTVRIVDSLAALVRVEHDGQTFPLLTLLELERAHPQLAEVLARLRERRTVTG